VTRLSINGANQGYRVPLVLVWIQLKVSRPIFWLEGRRVPRILIALTIVIVIPSLTHVQIITLTLPQINYNVHSGRIVIGMNIVLLKIPPRRRLLSPRANLVGWAQEMVGCVKLLQILVILLVNVVGHNFV